MAVIRPCLRVVDLYWDPTEYHILPSADWFGLTLCSAIQYRSSPEACLACPAGSFAPVAASTGCRRATALRFFLCIKVLGIAGGSDSTQKRNHYLALIALKRETIICIDSKAQC